MTQATRQCPENIFLWLCDLANKKSDRYEVTEAEKQQHLDIFLQWLALPRVRQVDDMLPYLRMLAGIQIEAIDLKLAREYFSSLIPEGVPESAKCLFLEIVEGVFMIYLHTRPQDQNL